ncbi:hypothetical protein ZIOFF_073156 [Zingiber officinale]|uniref:Uncharacterized protein n=1 Tax=Zingiber officinale TaxID=94328 RepID=A0A8J5BVQ4_ZINOF|nr:hypothetical protein ZIOFF_073156 [Zingiber officinale]
MFPLCPSTADTDPIPSSVRCALASIRRRTKQCHQPVSSSTLPLSLPSALLPTLDWVTPTACLSPETDVGHIPSSADQVDNFSVECCRLPVLALCPKSEQIR